MSQRPRMVSRARVSTRAEVTFWARGYSTRRRKARCSSRCPSKSAEMLATRGGLSVQGFFRCAGRIRTLQLQEKKPDAGAPDAVLRRTDALRGTHCRGHQASRAAPMARCGTRIPWSCTRRHLALLDRGRAVPRDRDRRAQRRLRSEGLRSECLSGIAQLRRSTLPSVWVRGTSVTPETLRVARLTCTNAGPARSSVAERGSLRMAAHDPRPCRARRMQG